MCTRLSFGRERVAKREPVLPVCSWRTLTWSHQWRKRATTRTQCDRGATGVLGWINPPTFGEILGLTMKFVLWVYLTPFLVVLP